MVVHFSSVYSARGKSISTCYSKMLCYFSSIAHDVESAITFPTILIEKKTVSFPLLSISFSPSNIVSQPPCSWHLELDNFFYCGDCPVPPQAEHLGGTRQDHGQHWGGGQK